MGGFLWWYTQRSWSLMVQSSYNVRLQSVTHVYLGCLPAFLPCEVDLDLDFTPGCSENISRGLGIILSPTADKPAAALGWHCAAERAVFAQCCLCPRIAMGSTLEQHRQLSCSALR